MSLTFEKKIYRKNIIVLPRELLDKIGLTEGMKVRIYSKDDKIIIEPVKDAIWLAVHGEKIASITLKELESISLEEQEKNIDKKAGKKA